MPRPPAIAPREAALRIVTGLQSAGYTAYFAGGCVRDELLGRQPKDYDVATDARPPQVRELFPGSRFVGEAFGVVLVRVAGHAVEVATFRTEWGYTDGRRPSGVDFSDAAHDAQRRDFTINGLFEDPLATAPHERIIDYVQGQDDLRHGVVRAIGDPGERFGEDFLRMLRAVRFASGLDFLLEARTAAAIRYHARRLGQISRERIGLEVQRMLEGPRPAAAATLMQELTLDGPTLLEDHAAPPLPRLAALPQDAPYPAALAAWMLDRHLPHDLPAPLPRPMRPLTALKLSLDHLLARGFDRRVAKWRDALCLTNEQRDTLGQAVPLLRQALDWPELPLHTRKRMLARRAWPAAATLLEAVAAGTDLGEAGHETLASAARLRQEAIAPPPLITGQDVLELGVPPGPRIGTLLDAAYDAQLDGDLQTRDGALEWLRERL